MASEASLFDARYGKDDRSLGQSTPSLSKAYSFQVINEASDYTAGKEMMQGTPD